MRILCGKHVFKVSINRMIFYQGYKHFYFYIYSIIRTVWKKKSTEIFVNIKIITQTDIWEKIQ